MNIAGCLLFFCLGRTAGNADGEDKMELKRSMHARAARLLAMLAMALVCALVVAPSAYADAAVARIDETGLSTTRLMRLLPPQRTTRRLRCLAMPRLPV